jgi:hypothetical protein
MFEDLVLVESFPAPGRYRLGVFGSDPSHWITIPTMTMYGASHRCKVGDEGAVCVASDRGSTMWVISPDGRTETVSRPSNEPVDGFDVLAGGRLLAQTPTAFAVMAENGHWETAPIPGRPQTAATDGVLFALQTDDGKQRILYICGADLSVQHAFILPRDATLYQVSNGTVWMLSNIQPTATKGKLSILSY